MAKASKDFWLKAFMAIIAVGVLGLLAINAGLIGAPAGLSVVGGGGAGQAGVTNIQCTEGTGYPLKVDVRNGANTQAAEYLLNSYEIDFTDTPFKTTGTLSTTDGLTTVTITSCNSRTGTFYAFGDESYNSQSFAVTPNDAVYEKIGTNASRIGSTALTSAFANKSMTYRQIQYVGTYSLNATGTVQGYLDLSINTSNTQWGASEVYFAVYYPDTTKFNSANAMVLTPPSNYQLSPIACPTDVATTRSAQQCWKGAPISSSMGTIEIKWQLTSTGDPVNADSPQMFLIDPQYFKDDNGQPVYKSYSSSGTDKGVKDSMIYFLIDDN